MSFCSLIKGITPKIRMPCFVLINSVFSFEPFMCLPYFSAFIPWLIMVCCTLRVSLSGTFTQTLPDLVTPSFFDVALRPRRRDGLLGTGTEWEGDDRVKARPRKPPEKDRRDCDRRQNNGSVKAVSPRHCPATCALRNCCFNCCAGQSH